MMKCQGGNSDKCTNNAEINVYNHALIRMHRRLNENLMLFIRTIFNSFQYVFWIELTMLRCVDHIKLRMLHDNLPPDKQLDNVNYSKEKHLQLLMDDSGNSAGEKPICW